MTQSGWTSYFQPPQLLHLSMGDVGRSNTMRSLFSVKCNCIDLLWLMGLYSFSRVSRLSLQWYV